ncbi:peptidylprolyl isomerase [Caulobacter sp. D4A]|uniref:FKBP-type peptidyl-prolyl cis-trans isomerase n=1 Tax=unclassified Caulobacter TaxID=2648921 RepID=UPI000D72DAB7|nr:MULTISPECIES: FKBP-type peptidyl-prolyl cis-trans isomerase [unclassified Caulobacter]PXA84009.1 peptidylprolyl isomerase [Caulobacter sp. D4A]PXA94281.1 peptidylprolyl isomerase [Caulobacter sp. D5]
MRARFLVIAVLAGLSLAGCGPSKEDLAAKQAAISANKTAGVGFLAENAKQPGVVTLPSGLQYKVVRSGPADGLHPRPIDEVKVHYEGKRLDGMVFDSSYERGVPASFQLRGLIPGWVEAMQLMRPGDEWMLYVPADLAYGDMQAGPDIPPGSTLVFKIELIDVLRSKLQAPKG